MFSMELDLETKLIRNLTAHYPHCPGYKASNPVVSDDGGFIAFQMASSDSRLIGNRSCRSLSAPLDMGLQSATAIMSLGTLT